MKWFFGLLLLSGVLAVLVSGRRHDHRTYCKLQVSNVPGGETLICLAEILDPALKVLITALADDHLSTSSIICITRQINKNIYYRVQYDSVRLLEISLSLNGDIVMVQKGIVR